MNGFLEGTDFLDAIVRKLKEEEGKEEHSRRHNSRKKEEKVQCIIMHKHVTYKKKLHHGQKPNPNHRTYSV